MIIDDADDNEFEYTRYNIRRKTMNILNMLFFY